MKDSIDTLSFFLLHPIMSLPEKKTYLWEKDYFWLLQFQIKKLQNISELNCTLKIYHKDFCDFKSKQKSAWSNVFWYGNVCIFWKFIQHTIHSNKTQMLRNYLRTKQMVQKMLSFFFREFQLTTVLLLICDSYMSWSNRFVKIVCGIFHFRFRFNFIKVYILFNKMHGLFDFKTA